MIPAFSPNRQCMHMGRLPNKRGILASCYNRIYDCAETAGGRLMACSTGQLCANSGLCCTVIYVPQFLPMNIHNWVDTKRISISTCYSHTTSENIATCRRRHVLMSNSSTSNTSHCLALKKVDGPTGGPKAGATTSLRFPPTFMVLMPFSKPAEALM